MSRRTAAPDGITPELMLRAYAIGVFPMAESADDPWLHWVEPKIRGIMPLTGLHISRSLAKVIRSDRFEIRIDHDFEAVLDACATLHGNTWISHRLRDLYHALFLQGHVHTVETWQNEKLVGGLFGISLGSAFFGESMFHIERDSSKTALAFLVARLIRGGYRLLDTQFITPHLKSMGGIELARDQYLSYLDDALSHTGDFNLLDRGDPQSGATVLRLLDQCKRS